MNSESIQIDIILSSNESRDVVWFKYDGHAMGNMIAGSNILTFPIPKSQWSRIIGNVVYLELKNEDDLVGRLVGATSDTFILQFDNTDYPEQTIERERVKGLYAVSTLRRGEHDPMKVYEMFCNYPDLAESNYLFEVLALTKMLREQAYNKPYEVANLITRTLNMVSTRIESALKMIGEQKIRDLTSIKKTLIVLLNGIHNAPLINSVLLAKRQEVGECLSEIIRQINLLKEFTKTDYNQTPTSSSETGDQPFNDMPLQDVRSWFMQLATNNSKNGKPFLTIEQVEQFIERAFLGNTEVLAPTLNATDREKGKVVGLFHAYFHYCTIHRPKTGKIDKLATAEKYIKLLTDNLDRWTFDSVKKNFRKGGVWQEKL